MDEWMNDLRIQVPLCTMSLLDCGIRILDSGIRIIHIADLHR